jgi:hypothetical protein
MNRFRFPLYCQLALAFYFQLIQWVPLGAWNFQPGSVPLVLQAIHGDLDVSSFLIVGAFMIPAILFFLGYRKRWSLLIWISLISNLVWLVLQIQTWWIGYIFGASESWASTYERVFSHSTKLLPSFGRHLAPDAMHFVLQILLLVALITTSVAFLKGRASGDSKDRKAINQNP